MTEFAKIFLFIIAGALFAGFGYILNHFLASSKPNPEKNSTYECGEEALQEGAVQFNMRFYLIGLVFLIFEVEVLFLFPWATVFAEKEMIEISPDWGIFALIEGVAFLAILTLGLAYVWKQGDLEWEIPPSEIKEVETGIPAKAYEQVNERYA